MIWEKRIIDVGDVKENTTIKIVFQCSENLTGLITNIDKPCSCIRPQLEGTNKIVVNYRTSSIPTNLLSYGEMEFSNKITVSYRDNTKDVLKFKGIIKK